MSGKGRSGGGAGDWWKWLAAGAGVAAVAAGVYFFNQEYKAEKERRKTQKSAGGKKATPSVSKASKAATESKTADDDEKKYDAPVPSDQILMQYLMRSMQKIQETGNTKEDAEKQISAWLKRLEPDAFSSRTRLISAQWMILYHTIRTMTATNQEEFKAAVDCQAPDMECAWRLLDCQPAQQRERDAVDLLKLDVSQRLKDHTKMVPVFDRVISRGDKMSYEEVVVAFTTAPLLGRWKEIRSLGKRIIAKQGSLQEFHKAALQRPDIPDYEVLYSMAEDELKRGDTPVDQLKWQVLTIKGLKIRLRDVQCADEVKANRVSQAFDPKGTKDWQTIPVGEDTKMLRFGGIAQMLSLSTVPIPMVGPATDTSMRVLGYAVVRPPQGQEVRQTESYYLTRKDTSQGVWEGTYSLLQERGGATKEPPSTSGIATGEDSVKIIFDMSMDLEEADH